jgi:prepilin signal peptidase PulO-like enzyme (type II secretory pathway)
VLFVIDFVLKKHIVHWEHEDRGFSPIGKKWRQIFYYSLVGGIAFSLLAGFISSFNLYAIYLVGVLSYVLIFSSMTDIIVHKAPKEVARYGMYATAPVAILAISDFFLNNSGGLINMTALSRLPFGHTIYEAQLWNLGIWMIVPLVLLIVGRGGVGMADIRLLLLFGVTMSWWVGIMGMFIAFFIANVLQILAFIPAKKFGWGTMITMKSGKQKRAVPFIPALTVSFLTIALYSLTMV